jgi:hypothetical protein
MQRARAFFYVCAGFFLLALSYHFGATTAIAQAPGNPVAAADPGGVIYTANGDAYLRTSGSSPATWVFLGNMFAGATATTHPTWGQLKATYRK